MKKNKELEVVFHGGLGNQLFQLFYALCVSREAAISKVVLNTSLLHTYSPPRDFELGSLDFGVLFDCDVSFSHSRYGSLRLPKVIRKLTGNENVLTVGRRLFIDGYFQDVKSYRRFDIKDCQKSLFILRENYLGENHVAQFFRDKLHHLRLGDGAFLLDPDVEVGVLRSYLQSENPKYIMTDKESLVQKVGKEFLTVPLNIVRTEGLSANKLLSNMGEFEEIKTNGSTLALWAAILYQREFESTDYMCTRFYNFMLGCS